MSQQRLDAAKKALEAALREWHMPTEQVDWHLRWNRVIQAAEELKQARASLESKLLDPKT